MKQTPAHEGHNPDLLRLIPLTSQNLIEVGCSTGALAREFKKLNPSCSYFGVEVDPTYSELARRHCDAIAVVDMDNADDGFFDIHRDKDCWVFGDVLEHLRNPWQTLARIRKVIPNNGTVVACIPNAQHWSVIAKLCMGDFRYADSGLMDRTHLRWFTRQTIIEMFEGAGFRVVEGCGRTFDEPHRDRILPFIAEIAKACGTDPTAALNDAIPLQYVMRAEPA